MAATLELAAEALREKADKNSKAYVGLIKAAGLPDAADWLQQRAKDLRGPTNEQ